MDGDRRGERDELRSASPASPPAAALAPCASLYRWSRGTEGEVAAAARQEEVARRRAISFAAGRDWGRADSAFTFRGHASSAVAEAVQKGDGMGNGVVSWPAKQSVNGHAGSAADLTSLSGAVLGNLWLASTYLLSALHCTTLACPQSRFRR